MLTPCYCALTSVKGAQEIKINLLWRICRDISARSRGSLAWSVVQLYTYLYLIVSKTKLMDKLVV